MLNEGDSAGAAEGPRLAVPAGVHPAVPERRAQVRQRAGRTARPHGPGPGRAGPLRYACLLNFHRPHFRLLHDRRPGEDGARVQALLIRGDPGQALREVHSEDAGRDLAAGKHEK